MIPGLLSEAFINDPRRVAGARMGLGLLAAASPTGARLAQGVGGAIDDWQQASMRALQQQLMQGKVQGMQDERAAARKAAEHQQLQLLLLRGALGQAQQSGKMPTLVDLTLAGVDPELAMKTVEALSKGQGKSPFAQIDPSKYTPESIEKFGQTGSHADLRAVEKPPDLTEMERLIAARDRWPEGHPNRAIFDRTIRTKADGRPLVTVNTGTTGQEAVDKEFGREYTDFVARGGYADVMKQLDQLEEAAHALETDSSLTGPLRGNLPDAVRAYTNPRAIQVREAVEEVVQRNLRVILGAQFTEREGERLISRAFNPRLLPTENAKRARRLITQIRSMAEAKRSAAEYFERHGSLQGWKGRLAPSPSIICRPCSMSLPAR